MNSSKRGSSKCKVGSGYDRFDRKEGIVCIFRWGFPGIKRRIFLQFLVRDIQSIRIQVKEGLYPRRILYMEIQEMLIQLRHCRTTDRITFLPCQIFLQKLHRMSIFTDLIEKIMEVFMDDFTVYGRDGIFMTVWPILRLFYSGSASFPWNPNWLKMGL